MQATIEPKINRPSLIVRDAILWWVFFAGEEISFLFN